MAKRPIYSRVLPGLSICLLAATIFLCGSIMSEAKSDLIQVQRLYNIDAPGSSVAVAWAPDGNHLAIASNYGADLTIWDKDKIQVLKIVREGGGPTLGRSLAFVKGMSQLAFLPPDGVSNDIALNLWDITTGKIVDHVVGPAPGSNYIYNRAEIFRVSKNQDFLAAGMTGLKDNKDNVVFYNISDWRPIYTSHIDRGVFAIDLFSPENLIAVGSADGKLTIIDPVAQNVRQVIQVYKPSPIGSELISSVSGSPDGKLVVVGVGLMSLKGGLKLSREDIRSWRDSIDPIQLYRVETGELVASLTEPARPIRFIAWDPANHFIAIADDKTGLFIWPTGGQSVPSERIELNSAPFAISISPTGEKIAVATSTGVQVFAVSIGKDRGKE